MKKGEERLTVIEDIRARTVYNSNKEKSIIEIDIYTSSSFGRASVPFEEDISEIEEVVFPELAGLDAIEQKSLDELLCEITPYNKIRFALSLASAKAASSFYSLPLFRYLGGLYEGQMPLLDIRGKIFDIDLKEQKANQKPKLIELDTISQIYANSKEDKNCIISAVDEGVCHLALAFNIRYLDVMEENIPIINELIRIKEYLGEEI
ncbi:MAG: hypothetical protein APG12_01409 [Candidatus Methanofastidiosum methylothiophilum]|uniref:Enolase N-terminal domain-containing protein n=1 Tax=Candidatus Methanofastidiosum methylothiophilum TaxID=1705564 RepID=A0A150IX73_9EURY|nr:MAG: hypothetical protein APG10_00062 [Candidatus Methanofastidiosum methylthiophilus]KYC48145.1 MAG: hypothetical protein APG11_00614 [Candidatus Methanofastidiosum methylthiophilus]KYC49573.1 MAG: hypothetical protein APG12_01409 [Candidatus Methanofastidiosum methylthiophilus]